MTYPDWQRGPGRYGARLSKPDRVRAEMERKAAQVEEAAMRAEAVKGCGLCDTDGYRLHGNLLVCDHVDHTDTNRRGSEMVRAALRKDQPGH